MKARKYFLLVLLYSSIISAGLIGCTESAKNTPVASGNFDERNMLSDGDSESQVQADLLTLNGYMSAKKAAILDTLNPLFEGLTKMREEEKLARDVYTFLQTRWNRVVFRNITKSEQMHMNAMKSLLDIYSIPDPVGENGYGVFTNPSFTQLYAELTTRGSASLVEALKVGAAIEEIDLLDLRHEMEISADFPDVQFVFTNLSKASVRHLKAYVYNLSVQGVVYTPQFMTQEEYDALMHS